MELKGSLFSYIFFFILFCNFSFSQQQNYFTHLTIENGLSQSSIFSITQDDFGFMWFATEDGLNKYDGNRFTVYRPIENDSNSIPDLGIRKVFKDINGNVWVITLRGKLCKYNSFKNNFKRFKILDYDGKPVKIISIVESREGILWIASTKGDFFRFNKKQERFEKLKLISSIENNFKTIHLQSLIIDSDNTFWVGTWEGLINFSPNSQSIKWFNHRESDPNSLGGDMVFSLAEDEAGNIWIASANGGVSIYLKSIKTFSVFKTKTPDQNSISSNRIMSISVDSRKQIWIGTFDKGLDLYNTEKTQFINFSHNPSVRGSFSIGAVMSIYEDKSGGVWFGTGGGGLNRYDKLNQNFHHIKYTPGNKFNISPNPVLAICEDHLGNLWIGSDGGGIDYKEKKSDRFIKYLQNPEFGSNAITAIYEDSNGNIWVGADPGSDSPSGVLLKFDRNKKSFVPVKDVKIKIGGISVIKEDKYGELWIATPSDGIHRYNPFTKKEIVYNYNPDDPKSVSSNSIFSIYEDSFGDLWFGSISSGLNLFSREDNSFIRFINDAQNKNSIRSNSIWCVCEDINKDIWVGFWGGGMCKYNRIKKTFINYTMSDGLPGNVVYNILPDDLGNLWISSNKGLSKFNIVSGSFRNFNRSDGLLLNDFSAGAAFKTHDGRLFFGGNSGVVFFDPLKIVENNFIPNVAITDFKVFDKPFNTDKSILYTKEIKLGYDQNFFTIEFAAFDYTAPEKNQFEYMLDGVDKYWVKSDGRNFARYTDITNGNYKFRLRGSNSSGMFSSKEVILSIIISPPFWKTWWFRIIMLALLLLLFYSIHKYRLNKLLEVERTRNRIARDLHDEVSASITGIVYFAEAIANELKNKSTDTVSKLINMISESASQIQEAMSDIIWSINPDNDDWDAVLPKLRRYASDICESKNIKYIIDIPEKFVGKSLKMEQRHDFWLIFKEIVTNAVKHSDCTELKIKLFNDSEFLYLNVTDNGKGFDSKIPSPNNGVKNIISRTRTLNGVADLITSKGNGVSWSIKIPLTTNK
jgi:ligand-binding sensor domain-containing protein/two-component sensor histidine kinase